VAQEDRWALVDEDLAPFRVLLFRLLRKSAAKSAMLSDTSGQLMTFVGERPDLDLTGFLALCAGDYAASHEMATMLGEDSFQALFHQGEENQIYITALGGSALLILLFGKDSTLGLVRWAIRKYEGNLMNALKQAVQAARERSGAFTVAKAGDPLAQGVDDALDAFFDA